MSDMYPDGPFPFHELVVRRGTLGASAHQNESLPLYLLWFFHIDFQPLRVGNETYETAINVDLAAPGVRCLEHFRGLRRHDTTRDFNIASFCLFEHFPSEETHFSVRSVCGNEVEIEVEISLPSLSPRPFAVGAKVNFEGILVSSYGTQRKPQHAELMKVAEQLFDLGSFAPPRRPSFESVPEHLSLWFDPLPLRADSPEGSVRGEH